MKKTVHFIVLLCVLFACGTLRAQDSALRTIEVGTLSTTHVIFASDLTYVDVASPDFIAAVPVQASKNMLALLAISPFDFETTVSALEANGTMHTFYVRYAEKPSKLIVDTRVSEKQASSEVNTQIRPGTSSGTAPEQGQKKGGKQKKEETKEAEQQEETTVAPEAQTQAAFNVTTSQTSNFGRLNAPTIQEVLGFPRDIYHVFDRSYRVSAMVTNIFAYSDLTYIVIELRNNSDIGYMAGDVQFNIENRRKSSKELASDKPVWSKSSYGTLSCPPNAVTRIGYTLPKQTLLRNEVLRLYIYEKGGNRNLFLVLDDKDLNLAVSPFSGVENQ